MLKAERRAEVEWHGDLMHGNGTILRVGSGALGNLPVTWASRTERSDGKTSPEELAPLSPLKDATDERPPATVVPSGSRPNQQPLTCALVASLISAMQ